jgi:hypothetical protein
VNDGVQRGPGVAPSRVVLVLVAGVALILVPLGVYLTWLGIVAPAASWEVAERVVIVALGTGSTILFATLSVSLIRSGVLGDPPVRILADGLEFGRDHVGWESVGLVSKAQIYGVPCLTIEIDPAALKHVALLDRLWMRFAAPPDHPLGPLWITEQQLGEPVEQALARVPSEHGA